MKLMMNSSNRRGVGPTVEYQFLKTVDPDSPVRAKKTQGPQLFHI